VFEEIARDLRFAARSLVRTPAFSLVAVLTLTLGIGATTAMFSVVDGVLLRSLPYPQADRLVVVRERFQLEGRRGVAVVSAPNFADWRQQATTVQLMSGYRGGEQTVLGLADPVRANVYSVSADYFRLFGGVPTLGRTFSSEESTESGAPVAVVSAQFWHDQLGERRDLANVHLQVLGTTYTAIGVMPRGFGFPSDAQLWIPLEPQNRGMGRDSHNDDAIARLAPGVSAQQAEAELQGIAERLKRQYSEHNAAVGAQVEGLQDSLVGPVKTYLRLLLGAVVVVLLVACVNLASANLARAAGRTREMTIRVVLGAGRGRLARQLLVENLLIAFAGGAFGTLLALWLLRTLLALAPASLPRTHEITISAPVLAFALGVTILTGLMIGLLPVLQVGRTELRADVALGGRGTAVGRSGLRRTLVATEVLFAVVLLVAAGLLVRSFRALLDEHAGFDPGGVLAIHVSLPESRYPTGDLRATYYTQALDALRALPGVDHVGLINIAPLSRSGFGGGMSVDGRPDLPVRYSDYRVVSPDYFATMRVPLVAGRMFTDADDSTAQHVTIINEAMAKTFFPGEDALGKRLIELGMDKHRAVPLTVVGVVADVRASDLSKPAGPEHFVPYRQRPERAAFGVLLVRVSVAPASIATVARSRLRLLDTNVLMTLEPAAAIRARSLGDRRFAMSVLTGFAVLALALAAIGIYGVLAYSVARRTREIGVRMALGAARGSVVRMVLGESLAPVAAGAAAGIAAALLLMRLLRTLLYGVTATDPVAFSSGAILLLGVAALASVIPAARAARVDPAVALRDE
jgi:putative ABC transport system permease protein